MKVYVDFSLFDQCRETLTTSRALQCLSPRELSNSFTKAHEQWYVCEDRCQYLELLVAVDKETSRLIAGCECQEKTFKNELAIICKRFHQGLSVLHENVRAYLLCPDEDSPCRCFTEKQLIRSFRRCNPVCLVSTLHHALASGDSSTDCRLAALEDSTTTALEEWIDFVALNCFRAYLFHRQSMTFTPARTGSEEIMNQIKAILRQLRNVKEESRKGFFMRKKTFTPIRPLFSQSELMYLVDGFFKESSHEPMDKNPDLAEQFGTQLEKWFPAYSWGVVVAEDSSELRNYLIYSREQEQQLMLQESIHPSFASSRQPRHHTYTNGNGFGVITCGRKISISKRTTRQRRVTVFWRKHDGHAPIDWQARKTLNEVDIRKLASKTRIKERSECDNSQQNQLEEALFASDSDYVICMGMRHKREDDVLGVYATRAGWPHNIQNETGHLFLWLSPYNEATQQYREKKLSRGALAGLTEATVRITHAVIQE